MPIKLHELTTEAEFPPIHDVEIEAFNNPFFGFFEVFKGPTPEEFRTRQWEWHTGDPSSHWIYVTDEDTGEVIAGTQWNIHTEKPEEGELLTNYWHSEGPFKDVAGQLLHGFMSTRAARIKEPHILNSFCFVHSKHRRRGAGALMMEWGIKKADELGLTAYVEATDMGSELYKEYGFKKEYEFNLDASMDHPSEGFLKVREELKCPIHGWFMRRPKGGKEV